MLEVLNQLDTECFLWINRHHCTALDWVFWTLSPHWFWVVAIVVALGAMTLRRESRRWWLVGIGIALCFLLADRGSVVLFKDTVCRLRPCHVLEDVRMFRTHCGGQYGFVSSHAANAFALVAFFWMRYRRWEGRSRRRALLAPAVMLLWALATCYSRAYLGKHYPGDLLGGALFGTLVGLLVHLIVSTFEKKFQKNETK